VSDGVLCVAGWAVILTGWPAGRLVGDGDGDGVGDGDECR